MKDKEYIINNLTEYKNNEISLLKQLEYAIENKSLNLDIILYYSCKFNYLEGVEYALETGANKVSNNTIFDLLMFKKYDILTIMLEKNLIKHINNDEYKVFREYLRNKKLNKIMK